MRIAVLGAGAMGQLFGTRLVAAGHDVIMIDAVAEVVRALRADGMTLSVAGSRTSVPVAAGLAHEVREPVAALLVFTKTMHSEPAISSVAHLIDEGTVGVSVQNGLGNELPLLERFGIDRTVIGMTDYPADRGADGVITSEETGSVVLGGLVPAAAARAESLAEALALAGLTATAHSDIMVPIWEKVLFNAALNTISGATGCTVGGIGSQASGTALVEAVLAECFAVAAAEGVRVNPERVRAAVAGAFRNHGEHKTSMLVDLEHGRATEVESIGGAIAAFGARRGVATPVLATLSDVVRLRTAAARPSSASPGA